MNDDKQMNRVLLISTLFFACLTSCSKSSDLAAQAKAQAVIDDKIITTYLNNKGLVINHVDTTGVCYTIDTLGIGNSLFTSSTTVTVGYTAALLTTGAVVAHTDNYHPSYILGQVIKGWQLGIPKISQGGTITLYVPSRYAYGPYTQPQSATANSVAIPANSVLLFNIKLYNVTN